MQQAQAEQSIIYREAVIRVAGIDLVADSVGALIWPEERVVVVSDLHLEKGSSFAMRGTLLPPYDTAATLAQLAAVIARYNPRMVISLGDSFHDGEAHDRLSDVDRASLAAMQTDRDWIWIAGNHDPDLPRLGGTVAAQMTLGSICFRHEPTGADGEIAGHLHPYARVQTRARAVSRRCFAADGQRMIMPAFGAYTGGLNIRDAAFAAVLRMKELTAHLLGDGRVHAFPAGRCLG
jgi:uncharacterized protein